MELGQIITWLYKQLYATNVSDIPDEDQQYQYYLDELLQRVREKLPDGVRLLRLQQIYRENQTGSQTQHGEPELSNRIRSPAP